MFVMLFGYPCFYVDDQGAPGSETDEKIFALITKGFAPVTRAGYGAHFPASIPCSDSAKDLISKLLVTDTARRLTAAEALEHPWLTGKTASDKPILSNVLNSLKAFQAKQKFKISVLNMMSSSLSDEEIAQLKSTFREIDANGDGKISVSELRDAVAKASKGEGSGAGSLGVGSSAEELERLMRVADIDEDGAISYDELLLTCVQRKINAKEERIWEAFCKLDLDGNGRLTKDGQW
jgi:calcium-dependent protein kinase